MGAGISGYGLQLRTEVVMLKGYEPRTPTFTALRKWRKAGSIRMCE
jgi:hypothetical protein